MDANKWLTVSAVLLTSTIMYAFVYWQCKQAITTLLIPHLPLKEETKVNETKGYFTLLNLVYFIFVVNSMVLTVELLAGLQIETTLKGLETWADIMGSQLFWLGSLVVGFIIALLILKNLFTERRKPSGGDPW